MVEVIILILADTLEKKKLKHCLRITLLLWRQEVAACRQKRQTMDHTHALHERRR